MSLQWNIPVYVDGDFTVAKPVTLPVFESPIPATTKGYVFEQDFQQFLVNCTPTSQALNTAHPSAGQTPDYSSYVLVKEGPRRDVGGGVVQWRRRYAIVPDSYDEFRSLNYNFIGFVGQIAIGNFWNFSNVAVAVVTGRPRLARRVDVRVTNDFFLVGTGGSYTDASGIPVVYALRYTMPSFISQPIDTDYLMDALGLIGPSTPSRTNYEGYMQNAITYQWTAGDIPGGTHPGQIISEDSILTRWEGNIWRRESFRVLAQ